MEAADVIYVNDRKVAEPIDAKEMEAGKAHVAGRRGGPQRRAAAGRTRDIR
jgi:hypothetical protein